MMATHKNMYLSLLPNGQCRYGQVIVIAFSKYTSNCHCHLRLGTAYLEAVSSHKLVNNSYL
jgi:hypothetical protein